MEISFSRGKPNRTEFWFLKNESVALRESQTEQVRQVFRASPEGRTYTMKNRRIQVLFYTIYLRENVSVTLLNGIQFMQLVLDGHLAKSQLSYEMGFWTAFKAQL